MKKYNIYLKPTLLREWVIIKRTKKCIVIRKKFNKRYGYKNYLGDCVYVPIKQIKRIEEVK